MPQGVMERVFWGAGARRVRRIELEQQQLQQVGFTGPNTVAVGG